MTPREIADWWSPADDAFALWLATLLTADLSPWEWRAFQFYRRRAA